MLSEIKLKSTETYIYEKLEIKKLKMLPRLTNWNKINKWLTESKNEI